jgi:hypothetical protein
MGSSFWRGYAVRVHNDEIDPGSPEPAATPDDEGVAGRSRAMPTIMMVMANKAATTTTHTAAVS